MIQTANADSRPTYYLRSGDPKGEEGHGGRVEGHHVGDESIGRCRKIRRAKNSREYEVVMQCARYPQSTQSKQRRRLEQTAGGFDANSKFRSAKDREKTESERSLVCFEGQGG